MNHLQEQGRAAYREGRYEKAIDFFNRAISRAPSVQLFDNRAACREKLGQLSAALKDTKMAIQQNREDPTGYLRAGKVLREMGKRETALEIYVHGLKSIKHAGKGYELLRKAQQDMQQSLFPSVARDPLTALPPELVEMIFMHLGFRQLIRASRVSKGWALFIRSNPSFWANLDLSAARRKVRKAFISRAINIGRRHLTEATLNHLWDFDTSLSALIKHCPLQILTLGATGDLYDKFADIIRQSRTLKTLILAEGTKISRSAFSQILAACASRLERFDCTLSAGHPLLPFQTPPDAFMHLHTLTITCVPQTHVDVVVELVTMIEKQMLHLQRLTMCWDAEVRIARRLPLDLSHHEKLDELQLRFAGSPLLPLKLPPSISKLSLHNQLPEIRGVLATGLAEEDKVYLPEMTSLDMQCDGLEQPGRFLRMLGSADEVRSQDLNESVAISRPLHTLSLRLAELMLILHTLLSHPRLRSLQHLGLPESYDCGDDVIAALLQSMPTLVSLDVSSTSITGVAVKQAVESGVKTLDVRQCSKLSRDAVDWARSQGVHVFVDSVDDKNHGGRKIRW